MHRHRGEEPARDAVAAEHLGVDNVVAIGGEVALDDDAEDVEQAVAMTVERGALQRLAVGNVVLDPLAVELIEGDALMLQERLDDPLILTIDTAGLHSN